MQTTCSGLEGKEPVAGIKRYILLSSVFARELIHWEESFLKELTDYNIAKHYADLYLTSQTKLNYTILQPGALKSRRNRENHG